MNDGIKAILGKLDILTQWAKHYDESLSKHINKTKEQLEEILEL